MELLKRFFGRTEHEPPKLPPFIRVSDAGMEVVGGGASASIRWTDVRRIIAYKYDLFGYDEICVGFFDAANADSWLEISEEWDGFDEAVSHAEAEFPSIAANWYSEIMTPAFVRKETVLWEDDVEKEPSY